MRDAEREKAKRGGLGGFPHEPSLQEALRGEPPLSFHTQEASPFRESGETVRCGGSPRCRNCRTMRGYPCGTRQNTEKLNCYAF